MLEISFFYAKLIQTLSCAKDSSIAAENYDSWKQNCEPRVDEGIVEDVFRCHKTAMQSVGIERMDSETDEWPVCNVQQCNTAPQNDQCDDSSLDVKDFLVYFIVKDEEIPQIQKHIIWKDWDE